MIIFQTIAIFIEKLLVIQIIGLFSTLK